MIYLALINIYRIENNVIMDMVFVDMSSQYRFTTYTTSNFSPTISTKAPHQNDGRLLNNLSKFNKSLSDLLFLAFIIKIVSLKSFYSYKTLKRCIFKSFIIETYFLLYSNSIVPGGLLVKS